MSWRRRSWRCWTCSTATRAAPGRPWRNWRVSDRELAEFEFGLTAAVECDDADVLADPVQLRTLLQNLLGNSHNYRRPGEDLRIRVSGLADERGVTVWVADNGKGIAAADRERVLEPLVRLHRPGDAPGSGLGLATCVRIVSSHGGATLHHGNTRRRNGRFRHSSRRAAQSRMSLPSAATPGNPAAAHSSAFPAGRSRAGRGDSAGRDPGVDR